MLGSRSPVQPRDSSEASVPALAQKAFDSPSAGFLWDKALDVVRQDGKTYALTWLERMRALDVREGALVLGVPDRFFRDWVDDHYRALLEATLARVGEGLAKVAYEVVEEASASVNLPPTPTVKDVARPPRLSVRFTFGTFVVSDSNQLPAAAAAAVADKPGH